jgi:hypothetical protein
VLFLCVCTAQCHCSAETSLEYFRVLMFENEKEPEKNKKFVVSSVQLADDKSRIQN